MRNPNIRLFPGGSAPPLTEFKQYLGLIQITKMYLGAIELPMSYLGSIAIKR